MSLVYMQNASFLLNKNELLHNVNFTINKKERICLVGNNGTGKSTFLNIIMKKEPLDHGLIIYKKNIKIKYLEQTIINNDSCSIYDFICDGIGQESKYLKNYFHILNNFKSITSSNNLILLNSLEEIFDKKKLWKKKEKIDNIIKMLDLKNHSLLSSLSAGCLRKIEIGKILVSEPNLIILDEPTNYLDLATINWLEEFLIQNSVSVLFVSHDRSFINNISTRIINLNSGNIISWSGNYDSFLNNQFNNKCKIEIDKTKFNKKLEQEKRWTNSGTKARTTKNISRIKRFKHMMNIKNLEQKPEKRIKILINENHYSGNILFKLEKVCFRFNEFPLINDFSDTVKKGEKIALIGTNGSGKTTLLKLIIGKLKLNSGNIYSNPNIKFAYFDQTRTQIRLEETVLNNLIYEKEEIYINNKKYHKLKYLENFLFSKNKVKLKAKALSGGERNKLLLAKLFLKESNVLILDEPTNDLDLESLQALEIALKQYKGIILLISHDKTFIQNIVNKYWSFEKNGCIKKYLTFPSIKKLTSTVLSSHYEINSKHKKNKLISKILNNNLKKELKNMPNVIEKIESNIAKLQKEINTSNFFHSSLHNQKKTLHELKNEEANLDKQFSRWEYLESYKK
ncbi:ATP-binding cassette domain-containing protein [Buchnera aphidicola]|uniref:ATP-binding cassette domain-containing protein n=1 Tax=Buchnera aphidicola subsp. Melaphis rhois TaxID=118103 RepID=A0A4D6Y341_BUCMH|nr:ATP-binding cassette domain-containing protein [Buchnera aphidicola]QCI23349.1 ATP-binding cassette domain-containing protein [Buchnera aphidicola (Melaphis rhois)]